MTCSKVRFQRAIHLPGIRVSHVRIHLFVRLSKMPRIDARAGVGPIDIIGVSRPHAEQTFLQALVSVAGVGAISLTVPFVVLLIGLPFALAIRGLLEAIAWLFGAAIL